MALTASLVDGLVLARSARYHSLNYRSVQVLGRAQCVEDLALQRRVSAALVDKLAPGRSALVRPPTEGELAATAFFSIPLAELSAKVRRGPPKVSTIDEGWSCWAGVVPLTLTLGPPHPTLSDGHAVST